MHNFSMLKFGGGQHLTLLRRIAQKAVRHDTQSDCRRAEEVQDNGIFDRRRSKRYTGFGLSGRVRFCRDNVVVKQNHWKYHWKQDCTQLRNSICGQSACLLLLLRHACGGCNHLVTEVAA